MSIELNTDHLLAAKSFACPDEGRTALHCLNVEVDKVVATDGHMIIKVPLKNQNEETCLIPQKTLNKVLTKIDKATGLATVWPYEEEIKIYSETKKDSEAFCEQTQTVDKEYPEYECVLPQGTPVVELKLSAKRLLEIAKFAIAAHKKLEENAVTPIAEITLKMYDETTPLGFDIETTQGTATGALMYMRKS